MMMMTALFVFLDFLASLNIFNLTSFLQKLAAKKAVAAEHETQVLCPSSYFISRMMVYISKLPTSCQEQSENEESAPAMGAWIQHKQEKYHAESLPETHEWLHRSGSSAGPHKQRTEKSAATQLPVSLDAAVVNTRELEAASCRSRQFCWLRWHWIVLAKHMLLVEETREQDEDSIDANSEDLVVYW